MLPFAEDIWAIACIFFEIIKRTPLFDGKNEIDQLFRIFSVLGYPSETTWPGLKDLPYGYLDVHQNYAKKPSFEETIVLASPENSVEIIELLRSMLRYNLTTRCTATQALSHRFFSILPNATCESDLPKITDFPKRISLKRKRISPEDLSASRRRLY